MPPPDTSKGAIVHYLYEPGDGGLDRVAILLANGMAARGEPTELWLAKPNGPLAGLISNEVAVRIVPTPAVGGRGMQLALQIPALARMIRKHQPRAIFSAGNQSNLNLALARNAAGTRGTKVIQKITNPVARPGAGAITGWLRARRFEMTARLGDACLTLSEADARDYALSMPAAASRFRAVRNAYVSDEMLARGARRTESRPAGPVRLLSVGRLAFQKDHATMLRALARLKDADWTLRILGTGPLQPELRAQAESLGIADRVQFEGFVADPGDAYRASDILLLSSRWEGFPAVPLEAMASGCDVVATDCSPGLSDLLATIGRDTVPIGDDAHFAAAIEAAVTRGGVSRDMRDLAAAYSISASVSDHLQTIQSA